MDRLDRDILFVGLTRPQMLLGVPYSYLIVNGIVTTELFLLFKSAWVLGLALVLHGIGSLVSLRDPRLFDLWFIKAHRCPRIPNYRLWRCNSYRP